MAMRMVGLVPTWQPGVKEQYEHPEFQNEVFALGRDLSAQCVPAYGRVGRTGDGDGQAVVLFGHELGTPAPTTRPIGEWKYSLCPGRLRGVRPYKRRQRTMGTRECQPDRGERSDSCKTTGTLWGDIIHRSTT